MNVEVARMAASLVGKPVRASLWPRSSAARGSTPRHSRRFHAGESRRLHSPGPSAAALWKQR